MNTKYISRFRASRAFIALIFPLFLASCGTDSNAQVTTVIEKDVSTWAGVTNVEVSEVSLVKELTVSDSLLLLNELISLTNESYNDQLNKLSAGFKLLTKSKSHLYFGNGEINQYYKKECDNYIAGMKETCKEINSFSVGLAGKYEPNREHIFTPYLALKNKKENEVLAKVYKATLNYHVPKYSGGRITGTTSKTEVRYFFISPDGTKLMKSSDQFMMPQGPQEQFLDFKRYSVDDEGKITILSSEIDSDEDVSNSASEETTIVAKYIRSEFMEYCNVNFRTKNSEDIFFINPELGEYQNEMCGMKDSFIGAWFEITYSWEEMKVHTEEGNETMDGYVIKKIKQVE